jgi:hypothetical protein
MLESFRAGMRFSARRPTRPPGQGVGGLGEQILDTLAGGGELRRSSSTASAGAEGTAAGSSARSRTPRRCAADAWLGVPNTIR